MKIAIPIVDTDRNKNTVAPSLSVTGCLCLYDNDSHSGSWMRTLDLAPDMGELLNELEREMISVIITDKIHPFALKVLVNKGFIVYRAHGKLLDENIRFLNEHKLQEYSYENAMEFAQSCGGECNTCDTECSEDKKEI